MIKNDFVMQRKNLYVSHSTIGLHRHTDELTNILDLNLPILLLQVLLLY